MTKKISEYRFEEWIEKSLNNKGYTSPEYIEIEKRFNKEYNKDLCLIIEDVIGFIKDTQLQEYNKLYSQFDSSTDTHLCKTINDTISKRGIIETLRKGISTRGCSFELVYFEPKSGLNEDHIKLFKKNRFVVVRQLYYSNKNKNSIDMVLFLNGIPIITLELKNQLTGQNIKNSENQYRFDRDPREVLLNFERCLVHFCVDNDVVSMTTRLNGNNTKFLPYNKGISNPIVEGDYRTEYLWNDILTPNSILDIIQNFVVVVEEIDRDWDDKLGKVVEKKSRILVFPRFHQLEVIRNLQKKIRNEGVGNNYLIQHTTGSGKSYSIGWLSHLLTSLFRSKDEKKRMFDTIIVITDRKVLDRQLQKTIKDLQQTEGVVNPVDLNSQQLKKFLEQGKDIIITTIQKFPVISETISQLKGNTFGVIIDEVHSSQSGEGSKHLKKSLLVDEEEDELDYEDLIRMDLESRGRQNHISFFGFTGTPKNKTMELFGRKTDDGRFIPFHSYTMKQSIHEGFTLDVLSNYTTYKRYFKVHQKDGREDIELPEGKVKRELVNFVDTHPEVIRQKVSIILDHFVKHTSKELNGKGRSMVVVRSRKHCVLFHEEMVKQMKQLNLKYSCLVGYSGTIFHNGIENTEMSLNSNNGMTGNDIPMSFKDPRYRILIVSNKFQTGFDEPMLCSMYVDKKLGGVQCVQTLSRLNRTKSGKTQTFILDFVNETEDILSSFQPFYTTTELVGETEPDKLYDIEYKIETFQLFNQHKVNEFCQEFYKKTDTDEKLHPIVDEVVENWKRLETEEMKDEFKSTIQSFIRLYSYISQITTFTEVRWEKLYVFLRFLNKKLPKKEGEKISITDTIDLNSLRIQYIGKEKLSLDDKIGELEPLSDTGSKTQQEEEKELLSEIIKRVNEVFGIELKDEDKVDLMSVKNKTLLNQELEVIMKGNNSYEDKKEEFISVVKDIFSDYYTDKMEFYKKVMDKRVFPMLIDGMFSDYLKQMRL
jgi:type I restriction enzyme R subunit